MCIGVMGQAIAWSLALPALASSHRAQGPQPGAGGGAEQPLSQFLAVGAWAPAAITQGLTF